MQSFLSTSSLCSSTSTVIVSQRRAAFRPCLTHSNACFSGTVSHSSSIVPAGGRLQCVDQRQCGVPRGSRLVWMAGASQGLGRSSVAAQGRNGMSGALLHVVVGKNMTSVRSRSTAKLNMQKRIGCSRVHAAAVEGGESGEGGEGGEGPLDANQLQTALNTAIAAEDYGLASQLRDRLKALLGEGEEGAPPADWHALGVPDWLAERAEKLGYRFPTEVQKRSTVVLSERDDLLLQSETGSGKTLAFIMPLLALLDYPPHVYPDDLQGPQLVVLVPTRELGVQEVMLIYKLLGGSVGSGVPGDPANMFAYTGPRGIKVRGVLDKEEVLLAKHQGYLQYVHVVVATPAALAELMSEPDARPVMSHVKAVAIDEVDACIKDHVEDLDLILGAAMKQETKPVMALVGATMNEDIVETAVAKGWLRDPVTVRVGPGGRVPAGLQHRYVVVEEGRKLATLCRQLRDDLQAQGQDVAPARVMVFAEDEEAARKAASPLRSALWGDHTVSVLLPRGEEPIKVLHSFRDNKTTFLLATPAAERGLDLPAVSHVYNLSPPSDATAYLHRAGRSGRIGSPVKGVVTTLVTPAQLDQLLAIADELHLDVQPQEVPGFELSEDPTKLKQDLEDLFNLY